MIISCSKVFDDNHQPKGWVVLCSREKVSPVFPSLILAKRWAEREYSNIKSWSLPSTHSVCKQVYGRM